MNKRLKSFCMFFLAISMVCFNFLPVSATDVPPSKVILSFDRSNATVGEIITANINVENISNFSGIQFHLEYDPTVLQAVDLVTGQPYPERVNSINFENKLMGEILLNSAYYPYEAAVFDHSNGTIDAMRGYMYLAGYRDGGIAETTGIVSKIGFKILQEVSTTVTLENCPTLSNPIDGTMIANWYGEMVTSGYVVEQYGNIN
ncbi:MAG TPA: cohesin domain-containing protein [Pseudobacteroides sp.]|uniref:cohesin domain-containing protein n=1 Tax=Pseudobacteroides sp. TaxID=1968840 RepID=UPI002F93AB18